MNLNQKIGRLVKKLTRFTNADKIRWCEYFFSNFNDHWMHFRSRKFITEWAQDGKPTLWMDNCKMESYEIPKLIQAIQEQYKRLKVGRYSDVAQEDANAAKFLTRAAEAKRRAKLNKVLDSIFEDLGA